MSNYTVNLPKEQLNKAKLRLINCFLKLTDKELDILCMILDDKQYVLTRSYRRGLIQRLKTTNYNFNNYIQRLKYKKVLTADEDNVKVNDSLLKVLGSDTLTFKFNGT
jgi:hypothetical protein